MGYQAFGMTVPEHMIESIRRYADHGVPAGGFLEAVISNDLNAAVNAADDENIQVIPAIVRYFYNQCPSACWGYDGAFKAWIERKRLERLEAAK